MKKVILVKKQLSSQIQFCKKKIHKPMFEDENHNKITFKHQDFYSANVFKNFKFFYTQSKRSQTVLDPLGVNHKRMPYTLFIQVTTSGVPKFCFQWTKDTLNVRECTLYTQWRLGVNGVRSYVKSWRFCCKLKHTLADRKVVLINLLSNCNGILSYSRCRPVVLKLCAEAH